MIICCSSHKFPFSPSFSFILRPVRIFQLLLILILNTEWQMICLDLSSHVSGTGTFPELGTTLMKDFYTKLFPERSGSRSRSGSRNVATFHIPGFYGLDSSFAHKQVYFFIFLNFYICWHGAYTKNDLNDCTQDIYNLCSHFGNFEGPIK